MSNFKMTIAYDGTDFHGVAEQKLPDGTIPVRTVIGELRPVLEMVTQAVPVINVSGRTDKGVHAKEQVVSFSFPQVQDKQLDVQRLMYVCNKRLNTLLTQAQRLTSLLQGLLGMLQSSLI